MFFLELTDFFPSFKMCVERFSGQGAVRSWKGFRGERLMASGSVGDGCEEPSVSWLA